MTLHDLPKPWLKEISQMRKICVKLELCKLCFYKQWFNLKDVPSGSVHLRLEWLSLLSSGDRLSEVSLKHN